MRAKLMEESASRVEEDVSDNLAKMAHHILGVDFSKLTVKASPNDAPIEERVTR